MLWVIQLFAVDRNAKLLAFFVGVAPFQSQTFAVIRHVIPVAPKLLLNRAALEGLNPLGEPTTGLV